MARLEEAPSPNGVDGIIEAVRRFQREGGKLPSERVLADRLNVKRHQLRKALAVLRENGDIHTPARRASASHPRLSEELVRITNPLEVLELRLIMEPGFARLASLRATAVEIKQIQDAASTPPNASSGAVDLSFHLAIVNAARNHLAREFYKMLRQVGVDSRIRVAQMTPTPCPERIAQRDAEHQHIADAIAKRDPDAAEAAMREHLHSVQKRIDELSSAFAT